MRSIISCGLCGCLELAILAAVLCSVCLVEHDRGLDLQVHDSAVTFSCHPNNNPDVSQLTAFESSPDLCTVSDSSHLAAFSSDGSIDHIDVTLDVRR